MKLSKERCQRFVEVLCKRDRGSFSEEILRDYFAYLGFGNLVLYLVISKVIIIVVICVGSVGKVEEDTVVFFLFNSETFPGWTPIVPWFFPLGFFT